MPKGDDALRKKKNKSIRKKLGRQKESTSTVSARVASIIASKKRRLAGKRRQCQGMCFSLPTPEDPFNDRGGKKDFNAKSGKKDFNKKETKKFSPAQANDVVLSGKGVPMKGTLGRCNTKLDDKTQSDNMKNPKNGTDHCVQGQAFENSDCPSKFLIMCLNSIENALRHEDTFNGEVKHPLFVNTWGVEFWKCYSTGRDILETSGACPTVEQIAWMVSTAADTIARKEKEGLSFPSPFLLFLVPSQEKAAKVRSVCKPLKALGIHTVSLHPGAPLAHQIQGLKSCEPEFLVSTPVRLLELISAKAIDISGVSLLVLDGVESLLRGENLDMIKSIRQSISGNPRMVVFNDKSSDASSSSVQNLLKAPMCRMPFNDSINTRASKEEKLSKQTGT